MYNAAEEPKILITGKWNESLSYQVCDPEGEPLPGTELKEVSSSTFFSVMLVKMMFSHLIACYLFFRLCRYNCS